MIKRIGHLAFDVSDMDRSLDFYCGVLGFEKAFELHTDDGQPWIVYLKVAHLQFVELFYGGLNKPDKVTKPIGFSHLCLEVDDIQQIAGHMKSRGIALDVEPKQGKDSNWQCWIRDPDGNRIEFMQLDSQSPQANA